MLFHFPVRKIRTTIYYIQHEMRNSELPYLSVLNGEAGSFEAAHPQILTGESRCNTMPSLMSLGNFTCANADVHERRRNKIRTRVKKVDIRTIFSLLSKITQNSVRSCFLVKNVD